MVSTRGDRIGVEAETRLTDVQAVERRIALKCRDSGVVKAVLLLRDTRNNRLALRSFEASLRAAFPIASGEALRALRSGELPRGWAIIMV